MIHSCFSKLRNRKWKQRVMQISQVFSNAVLKSVNLWSPFEEDYYIFNPEPTFILIWAIVFSHTLKGISQSNSLYDLNFSQCSRVKELHYYAIQSPLRTGPNPYFQTLSTIAFQSFYALNLLNYLLFPIYIPHFPTWFLLLCLSCCFSLT